MKIGIILALFFLSQGNAENEAKWLSFERAEDVNPILSPHTEASFYCPVQKREIFWEGEHVFNPGAVVRNDKVYLIYRAEDDYGTGISRHTSRLGLAVSDDGLHFQRTETPVLFPDQDEQYAFEWPGGCEDPRIVENEDGSYVMTYTQWNRQIPLLGVATSEDLIHWKKHGYVFTHAKKGAFGKRYSKSGSIVCRCENDRLIATKINGKYWMYWGVKRVHIAVSDDLISWEPLLDDKGNPTVLLEPRPQKFDSRLVEAGPPAILTQEGILFFYNGKNSAENGDPKIAAGAYSAGQVLIDSNDPTKILARTEDCFFKPEKFYEMNGQYKEGTVFIEGLVHFHGKWFLYYGSADSAIGVAVANE